MPYRQVLAGVLGAVVAIALAEAGARVMEGYLPVLSEWPSLETELKYEQLTELEDMPEVLIVGSSTMEAALDPRRLVNSGAAESAYNSSFPFYTPWAAELWLDRFIEPWGRVEVLLIGVRPSVPPAEGPMASSLGRLDTTSAAGASPLEELAMWRIRGIVTDLEEALQRERSKTANIWTESGHQTFYYEQTSPLDVVLPAASRRTAMPDEQEAALVRLVTKANSSGTTPIIVIEPQRFSEEDSLDDVMLYIAGIRELAEELGVEVWDTFSVAWGAEAYADASHFNQDGTVLYTDHIAELLARCSAC